MILNGTIAILIKYGYWKSQIVISNSSGMLGMSLF